MMRSMIHILAKRISIAMIFTMLVFQIQAQSNHTGLPNMKLDQLSDQQILQIWQKSKNSGASESEGLSQLVNMGMDPSEINGFKKRLLKIQSITKINNTGAKNIIKDSAIFMQDSTWVDEIPRFKKRTRYYGYEYFSNPTPILQPDLRVATPQNYILGPGDELSISIYGANVKEMDAVVSPEGTVLLEYKGFVSVTGLTIEDATKKFKSKLATIYPSLNNGGSKLTVTLSKIRSIRVTVIGEAEFPGDYVINAQAGFFNVLYLSNGPTINGSLRKIDLIRNNKVIDSVDFYSFLQKGMLEKNIRLQDQDVIRFRPYQKKLILSGEVRRVGIYELLEKETLADGLQYAGGLTPAAVKDLGKMVQNDIRSLTVKDVAIADFGYTIPHNGDSVFIDKILPVFTNRVVLEGAVYRPGNYELSPQLSVASLIKKADGLREGAFANRAYIKRNRPNLEPTLISFNIKNVLAGTEPDIVLMKDDSVFIAKTDALQNNATISVGGSVKNPGIYAYRRGMQIEDLILLANGFNSDAANHKVELSRLTKNKSDTLANQLLVVTQVDIDSSLLNIKGDHFLEPYDYIYVPQLLNYRNLGSVLLTGEVLYAGAYALEKRNETVQEIISRAGGITPFASMSDVQVYRSGLRVATDFLSKENNKTQKFLLQPGDSIHIPRNETFVEVKGAVFNPQILDFDSNSFLYYISSSGGVTDKGNLKKAYVQYSNGINRKIKHFLFFRNYPKIYPGTKIIVPEQTEGVKKGLNIIEISAITGTLTALVSLISILHL